jgi:hypothetical protein
MRGQHGVLKSRRRVKIKDIVQRCAIFLKEKGTYLCKSRDYYALGSKELDR